MKKPLTDRQKAIGVVIFLLLFVALSVFFWLEFSPIYCLLPLACVYLLEYGARIIKNKTYTPPLVKTIVGLWPQKTIHIIHAEAPKPKLLTSISQWYLKDYIQAYFYGDFSSIGTGTADEIREAYNKLISEYDELTAHESNKILAKLIAKKVFIETQFALVDFIASCMEKFYDASCAATMRKLYPAYTFSEETFIADFEMVGKSDISLKIDYDRTITQIEKIQSAYKPNEDYTPKQRHAQFMKKVEQIIQFRKVDFDIEKKTLMDFAVAENAMNEHYEIVKEQIRKNNG